MNNIEYKKNVVIDGDQTFSFGTAPWNYICQDLRSLFIKKLLQGRYAADGRKTEAYQDVVTAMSFTNNGTYYCLFRCVSTSRTDDYEAVWVFVPSTCKVDSNTFSSALNELKNFVRKIELKRIDGGDDDAKIKEILGTVKVTETAPVQRVSNSTKWDDGRYAFRKATVENSFSDIIKAGYQDKYNGFKAILIFDKETQLTGAKGLTDLTNEPLIEYMLLSRNDLKGVPSGVNVFLETGVAFSGTVNVPKNFAYPLILKREGFVDQKISIDPSHPEVKLGEWKFQIGRNMFSTYDKESGTPITNASISISGKPIVGQAFIPESNMSDSFPIEIAAPGYETTSEKISFSLGMTKKYFLQRKKVAYFVDSNTGHEVQVLLSPTKIIKDGESPIPFFVVHSTKDPVKKLLKVDDGQVLAMAQKKGLFKWTFILIALGLGLALGVALGHFVWKPKAELNVPAVQVPNDSGVDENTNEEAMRKQEAVEYLNRPAWIKTEMDNVYGLKGMWDAVNHYDVKKIQEILEKNKISLDEVQNLKAIVDIIKKLEDDLAGRTFNNNPDDFQLTIQVQGENVFVKRIKDFVQKQHQPVQSQPQSTNGRVPGPSTPAAKAPANPSKNNSGGGVSGD